MLLGSEYLCGGNNVFASSSDVRGGDEKVVEVAPWANRLASCMIAVFVAWATKHSCLPQIRHTSTKVWPHRIPADGIASHSHRL